MTYDQSPLDTVEALDGVRELIEPDNRGFRGRLGALVPQPNDGPAPHKHDNSPMLSDKSAHDWVAMRRAKNGTLMKGAIENKLAEIALRRGRALNDAANADVHALPPQYSRNEKGKAVYLDVKAEFRMDFTVSDLNTEMVQPETIPYQMDFRHRFGPPKAPRESRLASLTVAQYKALLSRMPTLHDERRDVPRGPSENRPRKEWQDASLRMQGKVKGKSGPPPFNPRSDEAHQHVRCEAIKESELLRSLMGNEHYNDFVMVLANTVPMQSIGERVGFHGKQAEAVGLDRCRSALTSAIEAFDILDGMNDAAGSDWLNKLPEATRLPAWLFQLPQARERCRQERRKLAREASKISVLRRKPMNTQRPVEG